MGLSGKREEGVTNLNAVVVTGAGAWVTCSDALDVLCVIDAATVTSGGTVLVQGNTKVDGSGTTFTIASVPVAATGQSTVSLEGPDVPSAIRSNVSVRTDGAYTTTIARRLS